jgi:hypothetical protein
MDDGLPQHPIVPNPTDMILERLVEANINRLAEGGAAAGDVLHLHPELLNPLHDRAHHVTAIAVED